MTEVKQYPIAETRISTAGVYRCCLASVCHEYSDDAKISIGMKSKCEHCGRDFTLVENKQNPLWTPDEKEKKDV